MTTRYPVELHFKHLDITVAQIGSKVIFHKLEVECDVILW